MSTSTKFIPNVAEGLSASQKGLVPIFIVILVATLTLGGYYFISSEGKFCGGFAANLVENQCPFGFICHYDGSYPDAAGRCTNIVKDLFHTNSQTSTQSPYTPTSSPTATTSAASPAPNGTGETANWNTYINSKYRFSVMYPGGFNTTERIGTRDDDYAFQVSFGDKPEDSLREIKIDIAKGKDVDAWVDYMTFQVVGHAADKIDAKKEVNINNNKGVRLEYTIPTPEIKYTAIVTTNGESTFIIISPSEYMDQILSTFKFLP